MYCPVQYDVVCIFTSLLYSIAGYRVLYESPYVALCLCLTSVASVIHRTTRLCWNHVQLLCAIDTVAAVLAYVVGSVSFFPHTGSWFHGSIVTCAAMMILSWPLSSHLLHTCAHILLSVSLLASTTCAITGK